MFRNSDAAHTNWCCPQVVDIHKRINWATVLKYSVIHGGMHFIHFGSPSGPYTKRDKPIHSQSIAPLSSIAICCIMETKSLRQSHIPMPPFYSHLNGPLVALILSLSRLVGIRNCFKFSYHTTLAGPSAHPILVQILKILTNPLLKAFPASSEEKKVVLQHKNLISNRLK